MDPESARRGRLMRPFVRFHMKAHYTNLSLDLNVKRWALVTLHLVQLTSREVSATASCRRDDDRLSRLTVTIHLQLNLYVGFVNFGLDFHHQLDN
jgi:hypothetical protein